MNNSNLSEYAQAVYDHNSKLNVKDPHKEFLKEYRKLMKQNEQPRGDCSIGNYCGDGGCYRWNCCDMQNAHPKSKELAQKLEKHEEKQDMSSNCGLKYEEMWIGRYYFKDKSEYYFDSWYNANCAKCKYMRDNVCWEGTVSK